MASAYHAHLPQRSCLGWSLPCVWAIASASNADVERWKSAQSASCQGWAVNPHHGRQNLGAIWASATRPRRRTRRTIETLETALGERSALGMPELSEQERRRAREAGEVLRARPVLARARA